MAGLAAVFHGAGAACIAAPASPSHSVQETARTTPAAIFGDDERRDLPDRYGGLEGKIGMIYEPASQTLCTAFCVAANVIATASHCLFQPKSRKLPDVSLLTFSLTYGKVSLTAGLAGAAEGRSKHFIAAGTTNFNREPPLSAPRDWALARLSEPACRFGVLDVASAAHGDLIGAGGLNRVFQIAYHWDYSHWKLAYSGPCTVSRSFGNLQWQAIKQHFVDADDLVLHDCDTGGASSGSPILMETPLGPVAVGINVGTYYTRTRLFSPRRRGAKRFKSDVVANTAVNARAFKHVIAKLQSEKMLESRDDIVRLQTELTVRGLYKGALDGDLGRATRGGIRSFERGAGMPQTGLATHNLLEQLAKDTVRPSVDYSTIHGPKP